MLTIRLSRIGKKNKPMYRLIISEKARDPYGKALEILGSYNPYTKDLQAKADRIKHWLSVGAQMSPSVNNLLIAKGMISGEKAKSHKLNTKKQLKKKEESASAKTKADEEAKAKEEKPASAEAASEKPEDKPTEAPVATETSSSAEATADKQEDKPAESVQAETPAPVEAVADNMEEKSVAEEKEAVKEETKG